MEAGAIIGRRVEQTLLQELYESQEPQLLALYGRRRIGKTYLISEFYKNKGVYLEITGIKDGTIAEQLYHFSYEFSRQFNEGNRIAAPANWVEAFSLLFEAVEKVAPEKKVILFFDEVPWLASQKSGFLNALEHCWNRYLSRQKNLIVIICGSAASWIIKNIINNKGGLHGRVTQKIRLLPFTLAETEEFLKSRYIDLDRKQLIDIYLAIGGVPKYLLYVEKGKSAAQIINDLCFSASGGLYDEFNQLFRSLFDNYKHHLALVKALAKSVGGLSKNELLQKTKLASGGTSSAIIQELIDSGFIIYIPPFGNKKNRGIYRLIDEYSLFYMTWVADFTKISLENSDPEFWLKKYGTPRWNAWSGNAFESLCLKHVQKIKHALGISGISTVETGWRYLPKKDELERGAQIDLVIDRADKCINLCEMKYSDVEFCIDKSYAAKLQDKKMVFRAQTKTNKTLFITMVTTYGVKKNSQCLSVVDNQVLMDQLFER